MRNAFVILIEVALAAFAYKADPIRAVENTRKKDEIAKQLRPATQSYG